MSFYVSWQLLKCGWTIKAKKHISTDPSSIPWECKIVYSLILNPSTFTLPRLHTKAQTITSIQTEKIKNTTLHQYLKNFQTNIVTTSEKVYYTY